MDDIEIIPNLVKKPRGRPRIYPAKEINPDLPKRGRGRPRIHPIAEVDEPKRAYNKPALSRAEHNKLYRLRHPEMNNKYWKKKVMCDICQKEYLTRNIEIHKTNKIHLANLFKKLEIEA